MLTFEITAEEKNSCYYSVSHITILFLISLMQVSVVQAQTEYQRYVHSGLYSSRWGYYTLIDKPGFPVNIANNSIAIGQNYTIMCPLQAGHTYHVYCYGAWVNTGSASKTDCNIYVYDSSGKLESEHTEAGRMPEHLVTTVNEAYFIPKSTGNYVFVLNDDLRVKSWI